MQFLTDTLTGCQDLVSGQRVIEECRSGPGLNFKINPSPEPWTIPMKGGSGKGAESDKLMAVLHSDLPSRRPNRPMNFIGFPCGKPRLQENVI